MVRTSPGCRRRPSCSTGRGCCGGSISILPRALRCCSAKSWCSAAPRWVSGCCMANSSTAGECGAAAGWRRSEEHTSELQSRSDLVCRLLLEKKKKKTNSKNKKKKKQKTKHTKKKKKKI